MTRLFLAFDIPEPSKGVIFDIQTQLQRAVRSQFVTWIPETHWHITVQFIGNVDESNLARIKNSFRDVRLRSIDLQCWGVNTFPLHASPRNMVLQFADLNGSAFSLYDWWTKTMARLGVVADTRPWMPHVTLGRIRAGRTALREYVTETHVPKTPLHIRTLTLYASKLTEKGPTYLPVDSMDMLL